MNEIYTFYFCVIASLSVTIILYLLDDNKRN